MKQQIVELRNQGLTYREIQATVGCSKGSISYYLGKGQKEKTLLRQKVRRSKVKEDLSICLSLNSSGFKQRFTNFRYKGKLNRLTTQEAENVFYRQDGKCYLSGLPLTPSEMSFDHIIPVSKGGSSCKDNLGITLYRLNKVKSDLTLEELLYYCELILTNFNYQVEKPSIIESNVLSSPGNLEDNFIVSDELSRVEQRSYSFL